MLALGLLSIVQIALLPGLIGVLLLRLTDGLLRMLVLSFAFSILFNYLLVLALSALHIAAPVTFYIVFASETAVLIGVLRRRPVGAPLSNDIQRARALLARVAGEAPGRRLLGTLAIVLGTAAVLITGAEAIAAAGRVFNSWDAVASWNKWAVEWFAQGRPTITWSYPQLLPAIYSETYQFIRTSEVHFFALALTGLFPLAMYLAMADLALRAADLRYMVAIAATRQVLNILLVSDSMSGCADEPMAAVIFLSLYALISADGEPARRKALLLAGTLCAAAASVTKQQGLLLAGAYPVLVWLVLLRDTALPPARRLAVTLASAAIPALTFGPWYLYCAFIKVNWGVTHLATGIHAGRGLAERAAFAMNQAHISWGPPAFVLGTVGVAALVVSLVDRLWRWITLLVTVPLLMLWLFIAGYTARNSAAAVPLLVTGGVVGAGTLLARLQFFRPRPAIAYTLLGLVLTGIVSLLGLTSWRASKLLRMSRDARSATLDATTNRAIYRYAQSPGFQGQLLTNYQVLQFLPDLGPLYRFHSLEDEGSIDAALADPGVSHVLYFTYNKLTPVLQRRVDSGRLTPVSSGPLYYLYKINRP